MKNLGEDSAHIMSQEPVRLFAALGTFKISSSRRWNLFHLLIIRHAIAAPFFRSYRAPPRVPFSFPFPPLLSTHPFSDLRDSYAVGCWGCAFCFSPSLLCFSSLCHAFHSCSLPVAEMSATTSINPAIPPVSIPTFSSLPSLLDHLAFTHVFKPRQLSSRRWGNVGCYCR